MPWPDRLLEILDRYRIPHGYERSFRLSHRYLGTDRFLVSTHVRGLPSSPMEFLRSLAGDLAIPPDVLSRADARVEVADILHLGHERQRGRVLLKIYLEDVTGYEAARARGGPAGHLVHEAYKWCPGTDLPTVITHYRWVPVTDRRDLDPFLEDPAILPAHLLPGVTQILAAATARVAPGELMLLEVLEPGTHRRSLDLNLYPAELRLGDIAEVLGEVATLFAIPLPAFREHVLGDPSRTVGHLAAGTDREGRPFLTLYHGMVGREYAPPSP